MQGMCVEYAKNMDGRCMEYAWNMYGICMEYTWNMRGIGAQYAWHMHGICMEYTHGLCMEYAWNPSTLSGSRRVRPLTWEGFTPPPYPLPMTPLPAQWQKTRENTHVLVKLCVSYRRRGGP